MITTVGLRYASIVLQFAILTVMAQRLSLHDYGQYVFVLSATLPAYFLVGLGASEAYVRDVPRLALEHDEDVRRRAGDVLVASTITVAGGLVVALLCLLIASPAWHTTILFIAAFLAANGFTFNAAQVLLGSGHTNLGSFFFYPATNLALAVVSVPYVLLADGPTFGGVAVATSCGSIGMAVAAVGAAVAVTRPRVGLSCRWSVRVGEGFRLTVARGLYAAGLWLPALVAGVLMSPAAAAVLGTAGRLAAAASALTAAVRFAVRPRIVRAHAVGDVDGIIRLAGRLGGITFSLTLAATAASVVAGPVVVQRLFGDDLRQVAPVLTLLLVGVALECFGGPVDEILKMTGHDRHVVWVFALGTLALTVTLIAASHVGTVAMASAQVSYTAAVFGALIVAARRHFGRWLHPWAGGSSHSRVPEHAERVPA